MFKRLFIVGILTGAGQLYSLWVLKEVSGSGATDQVEGIAQADLLFFLLMNIIAMGLQPAAIRDIATSHEWKTGFYDVQSARLTLSLFLFPVGLLFLHDTAYAVFLMAPLLALSGDYALYALSKPVEGAAVAFLRTVIPYSFLLAGGYWAKGAVAVLFILGIFVVYLFSDKLVARLLDVELLVWPRLDNLRLYLKSMLLGVVNLSLYFIGPGMLLVVPFFYGSELVAISFSAVKFYFIYKGVLRIIHQSFVREMLCEQVCLKVDKLSVIIATGFFCSIFVFPITFIKIFFGDFYLTNQDMFKWLGAASLIYAFALSQGTRSLLFKKDKSYAALCIFASLAGLFGIAYFSYGDISGIVVAKSIFFAELFFTFGLILLAGTMKFFLKRLLFLTICMVLSIPFFIARFFFHDSLFSLIGSLVILGGSSMFLIRKDVFSDVKRSC